MTHPSVTTENSGDSGTAPEPASVNKPRIINAPSTPDGKLTPEQRTRLEALLPAAAAVIQGVEDRMTALSVAATARWVPEQSAHDVDENAAPVFGDEEYADFLALTEEIAENAIFQEVAKFFGIPSNVIDTVLTESLRTRFVGSSTTKKAKPTYVSHRSVGTR